MEKYVSFQLGNLRFLDSLQFLGPGASLDKLAKNLKEFPHLKEQFPQVWTFNQPEYMDMVCQKGIYPYSYMKNFETFQVTLWTLRKYGNIEKKTRNVRKEAIYEH